MTRQTDAKRERVIEAVRRGLQGDDALAFIHTSGYAMTTAGIARHLRALGGRGRVQELIDEGKSNTEILAASHPTDDANNPPVAPLARQAPASPSEEELFPTKKLTLRIPSELYEAIRTAARAMDISQSQLIVDILTRGLSEMPERPNKNRSSNH